MYDVLCSHALVGRLSLHCVVREQDLYPVVLPSSVVPRLIQFNHALQNYNRDLRIACSCGGRLPQLKRSSSTPQDGMVIEC